MIFYAKQWMQKSPNVKTSLNKMITLLIDKNKASNICIDHNLDMCSGQA